ncbi:putative MFS multidrug transporter [Aspergillus undulatus]|uniref:putative MFS multidrug transporter n=1 Tax=Aspergillus undulatus TaxID=1810928 RepID=UPI003CCE0421
MAYYLYKKIKASRAAKQESDTFPLETQSSPFERNASQDGDTLASTNPIASQEKNPSPEAEAEKRRRRTYRWKLIGALFMPYLLATLDLTIVATAVPFIASHFNELDELNWIVTAFTLTSTGLIPTFGQLADVFGRHAALQLATFLMLVGSVLCAAAQTWGMLLLGRALQGVASAGLMTTVMIVLADNVTLEENAKNNSTFALVGGVAYSVGPVVGGYSNWRYCFVISIPIAFVSHIIIYLLLRKELKAARYPHRGSNLSSFLSALATIDIIGTILFLFGVGLIILGTAWGGSTYPWTSAKVLAPLIVGGVCFVFFFCYEYLLEMGTFARILPAQKPMLPYSLFKKLDTLWLAILQFSAGAAMYSVFYYIGIYFTLVEEYPASRAGVQLLYYIPGLGAGVYLAILMCNTIPAQTFHPLTLGTILETLGIALVTYGIRAQKTTLLNGMMVLAGAGTGIRMMPSTLHAAGIWPDRIAAALSLLEFAEPFGGTLGITIMGSVFNNKLSSGLASIPAAGGSNSVSAEDLGSGDAESLNFISSLPNDIQRQVRLAGRDAIMWAYIAILPILGLSVITGLFMGNVWIRKKSKTASEHPVEEGGERAETAGESEVIYVPYLYALMKGVEKYKRISRPVLSTNGDSLEEQASHGN